MWNGFESLQENLQKMKDAMNLPEEQEPAAKSDAAGPSMPWMNPAGMPFMMPGMNGMNPWNQQGMQNMQFLQNMMMQSLLPFFMMMQMQTAMLNTLLQGLQSLGEKQMPEGIKNPFGTKEKTAEQGEGASFDFGGMKVPVELLQTLLSMEASPETLAKLQGFLDVAFSFIDPPKKREEKEEAEA